MNSGIKIKPSIYFRTDGNENIGLGHLYRCLSLAEIVEPFFNCIFILSGNTPVSVFNRINFTKSTFFQIETDEEKRELEWIISRIPYGSLLVIDSYTLRENYFSALLKNGYKTVFIDDQGRTETPTFAVINHLIGCEQKRYTNSSLQYLGTSYAILRKQFLQRHTEASSNKNDFLLESILISLGGADKMQITNKILNNLLVNWPDKKINVLVGSSFKGLKELDGLVLGNKNVSIFKELNASEIIDVASASSLAIITPGMISYELFSVGAPAICGYISVYQQEVVKRFEGFGIVASAEDFNDEKLNFMLRSFSPDLAKEQIAKQKIMFDGKSGQRLIAAFKEMYDRT